MKYDNIHVRLKKHSLKYKINEIERKQWLVTFEDDIHRIIHLVEDASDRFVFRNHLPLPPHTACKLEEVITWIGRGVYGIEQTGS